MSIEEVKKLFNEKNQRFTKSREILLSLFLQDQYNHFTIDDLINSLVEKGENNVATVYNNLAVFVELNIVEEFNFNNKKHYELAHEVHGHFVCDNCGCIFNVDVPGLACLRMEIAKKYGADVIGHSIDFNGLCNHCSNKNSSSYNFVDEVGYEIDITIIDKYVSYLNKELKNKKLFSIVFVNNTKIKELNLEYRNMNNETDVLSFEDDGKDYLGDIIISIDKMKEQAIEYKHDELRELMFLITHGFLHLNGYDHLNENDEKEMFTLQEKLLKEYGYVR